ncbi:hypothetical protein RF679_11595 [Undibacterium cyanobacteriorum]|uniref:ABC transporter permease n=1 Tax=Undibacterium cyanobacteriorum TaxID=3073561 RepID=A0ABY9REA6_9BURK|nr:hypothetical protein [Undibacterium sp. 20NA77.5]WMW79291.1 hypothetical protein RF679_11595 [Undibacterium sp. 20NA77.5]
MSDPSLNTASTMTPIKAFENTWSVSNHLNQNSAMRAYWPSMKILIATELRLRARRWTTLFALFLMVMISWNIISDPASGVSMMVINHRRTLYTSSALALGSACLFGIIMLFAGFYLLRGRVAEDVRTGIGSLIGSSPIPNSVFLVSRWIAGVAYFMLLAYTGMFTVMVLQLVRGEPGLELWPYLQTYTLVYLPLACYVTGIAILFDSVPWLMGKLGDFLYFILWVAQMSLLTKIIHPSGLAGELLFVFDFTGLMTAILNIQSYTSTSNFSLGGSSFDPALEPWRLPSNLWTLKLALLRVGSALTALLPFWIGVRTFHRYSSDKIKLSQTRRRRNPIQMLNDWTRPLSFIAKPLMKVSVYLPNAIGQVIAEVALSLISAPILMIALIALNVLSLSVGLKELVVVQIFGVLAWGMLIADISTRDFQSGMESLTGVAKGGSTRRLVRHYCACVLLAFMFVGVSMTRLAASQFFFVEVMVLAIFAVSAMATALGCLTRNARPFLAVFLFWTYIASQATKIGIVDLFGYNHSATMSTVSLLAEMGGLSLLALVVHHVWKSRKA